MKNFMYVILSMFLLNMEICLPHRNKPPNKGQYMIKKDVIANKDTMNYIEIYATVLYYNPTKRQCDNTPLITSDGSRINLNSLKENKIKWCAVSKDILRLFPKNKPKRIWIENCGIFEIHDNMNKRHRNTIDILVHEKNKACISGKHIKVRIIL